MLRLPRLRRQVLVGHVEHTLEFLGRSRGNGRKLLLFRLVDGRLGIGLLRVGLFGRLPVCRVDMNNLLDNKKHCISGNTSFAKTMQLLDKVRAHTVATLFEPYQSK